MSTMETPIADMLADEPFGALLRDAAEWRLLALLFARPTSDWREDLARLADEITDANLRQAAEDALAEATIGVYDTAFGPGGPGAPREISHRPSAIAGQYLAELIGYYDAFGYKPSVEELADHVAVELDFVAYLRLKQAYAAARHDHEQAAIAAAAMHHICAEHLSVVAPALTKAVQASDIAYLQGAAEHLFARLGPYCQPANGSSSAERTLDDSYVSIINNEDCCGAYGDD